jgi:hypothetical protein
LFVSINHKLKEATIEDFIDYGKDLGFGDFLSEEPEFKPEAEVSDNWLLEEEPWTYD